MFVPAVFLGMAMNVLVYVGLSVFALVHGDGGSLWVYILAMLCTCVLVYSRPDEAYLPFLFLLAYAGIVSLAFATCDVLRSAGIVNVVLNLFIVLLKIN